MNNYHMLLVFLIIYCGTQYVSCNSQQDHTTSSTQEETSRDGTITHYPSVKEIVDRLHQLDADIGRLMFNSSSLYSSPAEQLTYSESPKSGEKFSEVLTDLDSLQDEINVLIKNSTRTRQYNILVRLRPLNNILYRIRHNLQLMRNSLVALNAVTSLEKIANSVLDTTLTVFLKPDAPVGEEGPYPGDEQPEEGAAGSNDSSLTSSEEAAIAEAEAAANAQDFNNPDYDQAQFNSLTTTPDPPSSSSQITLMDQPIRRPDQQTRPTRVRVQQSTPSTPSTSTTTTTAGPIEISSQKTSNSFSRPAVNLINVNNNRNSTPEKVPHSDFTRPNSPANRARPASSRPYLLESATELAITMS